MAGSPQFPKLRGADSQQSRVQDGVAGQLGPVGAAVAKTPMLNGATPQWVNFSLLGGFTNAGSAVSAGLAQAGWHKDSLLYVHLQGSITHAAGVAAGTVLAALPQGSRPRWQQRFPVKGTGATFQSLLVDVNGNISVEVAVAAGGFVDLSGSFLADG